MALPAPVRLLHGSPVNHRTGIVDTVVDDGRGDRPVLGQGCKRLDSKASVGLCLGHSEDEWLASGLHQIDGATDGPQVMRARSRGNEHQIADPTTAPIASVMAGGVSTTASR